MGIITTIACVTTFLLGSLVLLIIGVILMMLFLQDLFEWAVKKLLFFWTWETRGDIIKIAAVLRSNFFARNFLKRRNFLTSKDGFPTPYYYTNRANGKQSFTIFIKQLIIATMKENKISN